jgi:hypothetical protein
VHFEGKYLFIQVTFWKNLVTILCPTLDNATYVENRLIHNSPKALSLLNFGHLRKNQCRKHTATVKTKTTPKNDHLTAKTEKTGDGP